MHMCDLLERMILPINAGQAVRFFFNTPSTSCNRLGGTQSNKPPLVWASASRRRTDSGVLFHSTMAFAVSRFCLVPPGTQSCAMSEKTSAANHRHFCRDDFCADATGAAHRGEMSQQTKASHIN